jgi:hypothetical protein
MAKNITDIRKQAGASNAGKYPKGEIFCGTTEGTFPITENGKLSAKRLKSALTFAHNDPNPEKVKACVYRNAQSVFMKFKKENK